MKTLRAIAVSTLLGGLMLSNAASAYERWINVINDSNVAVQSIHITNVDDTTWRSNLLGNSILSPGYQIEVEPRRPNGYCLFDILITYMNGAEEAYYRVNLCKETELWV